MTPEQIAKAGTEHAYQVALFSWANKQLSKWPELRWMYAIPNAAKRTVIVAARMKAEGLKSGISDVCLPVPRRGFHGFYFEMKKKGGKESDNQKEFKNFIKTQGYFYNCFYSYEEARDGVIWYMGEE